MFKPTLFEIILGTYEEFLIGYKFNSESNESTQSFASHSHSSSVRCVASSDYYLASGGADDRIVVYDLRSRKEHCMLTHHNATINCLKFTPGHTHLICGSSDGVLSITRVGNWQVEKLWENAHKGAPIIDIAVHSSGKLALSLGGDATVRTWNLVKGRQAYVINLNSKVKDAKLMQFINWSPNDVEFVLSGGNISDIWSIETGGIIANVEHDNKVTKAIFFNENVLLVGFENGDLTKFDTKGNLLKSIRAHNSRVKSLDKWFENIITCSSDGEVKVFNSEFVEVTKFSTGCRHTCLTVVPALKIKPEPENDDKEVIKISPTKVKKKARVEVIVEENEESAGNSKPKKKRKEIKKEMDEEVGDKIISKKKKKEIKKTDEEAGAKIKSKKKRKKIKCES